MPQLDLCSLDVLPGKCSIEGEVRVEPDGWRVRFRASQPRRWWWGRRTSEWSGWFVYEGEPIVLHWVSFWGER